MVTIYMVKKTAVLRLSGTRENAYQEMYQLSDVGWRPVNKTAYERRKKQIRMPSQKASTA
jgi:hypothetical protein